MLRQSVILVTRDASNITQSDLQYTVTKIVTTIQCKLAWFNVKAKKLWITINSVSTLVLLAGIPQVCILFYFIYFTVYICNAINKLQLHKLSATRTIYRTAA